ncbi:MAG: hypothetical protein ABSC19_05010 [Syntrophorhabdales bacterium]|jgi:hypothetical protein
MSLQVQQIIKAALQDIGAVAKSESPTNDEMQDGLTKLNSMIDAWSVRSLMVLGTILEGFPLAAGTYIYTIGAGGAFNTSKPSAITDAYVRDGGSEDTPVEVITQDEYNAIDDKAISLGRPLCLYFDPGATQQPIQTGVIYIYPAPDASTPYTLYLNGQKALTEFSAITDTVTFQAAYYEALEYNLAVRLWPQYHDSGKPVSQDIRILARESVKVIETMNAPRVTSTIEVGKKGGVYNIYTGEYA